MFGKLSSAGTSVANISPSFKITTQFSHKDVIRMLPKYPIKFSYINRGGEGCHLFPTCVYGRKWTLSSLGLCLCPGYPLGVWEGKGSHTRGEPRGTGYRCARTSTYLWCMTQTCCRYCRCLICMSPFNWHCCLSRLRVL